MSDGGSPARDFNTSLSSFSLVSEEGKEERERVQEEVSEKCAREAKEASVVTVRVARVVDVEGSVVKLEADGQTATTAETFSNMWLESLELHARLPTELHVTVTEDARGPCTATLDIAPDLPLAHIVLPLSPVGRLHLSYSTETLSARRARLARPDPMPQSPQTYLYFEHCSSHLSSAAILSLSSDVLTADLSASSRSKPVQITRQHNTIHLALYSAGDCKGVAELAIGNEDDMKQPIKVLLDPPSLEDVGLYKDNSSSHVGHVIVKWWYSQQGDLEERSEGVTAVSPLRSVAESPSLVSVPSVSIPSPPLRSMPAPVTCHVGPFSYHFLDAEGLPEGPHTVRLTTKNGVVASQAFSANHAILFSGVSEGGVNPRFEIFRQDGEVVASFEGIMQNTRPQWAVHDTCRALFVCSPLGLQAAPKEIFIERCTLDIPSTSTCCVEVFSRSHVTGKLSDAPIASTASVKDTNTPIFLRSVEASGGIVLKLLVDGEGRGWREVWDPLQELSWWPMSSDEKPAGTVTVGINEIKAAETPVANLPKRSILKLHLMSAKGLLPKNFGDRTSNPVIQVLRVEEGCSELLYRSQDQNETLTPVWNETLDLPLTAPKNTFHIEVVNGGLSARTNTFLGTCALHTTTLPCEEITVEAQLEPRKLSDGHWNSEDLQLLNTYNGLGSVAYKYSVVSETCENRQVSKQLSMLRVCLVKGEGLTPANIVNAKVRARLTECRTALEAAPLTTVYTDYVSVSYVDTFMWNEWTEIPVTSSTTTLEVSVYDKSDSFLGTGTFVLDHGERTSAAEEAPLVVSSVDTDEDFGRIVLSWELITQQETCLQVTPSQWTTGMAHSRPLVKYVLDEADASPPWLLHSPNVWGCNCDTSHMAPPNSSSSFELFAPHFKNPVLYVALWDGHTVKGSASVPVHSQEGSSSVKFPGAAITIGWKWPIAPSRLTNDSIDQYVVQRHHLQEPLVMESKSLTAPLVSMYAVCSWRSNAEVDAWVSIERQSGQIVLKHSLERASTRTQLLQCHLEGSKLQEVRRDDIVKLFVAAENVVIDKAALWLQPEKLEATFRDYRERTFHVSIVEGKGLAVQTTSKHFVVGSIGASKQGLKFQTQPASTPDPVWNQRFQFPIHRMTDILKVEVWSESPLALVGEAQLELAGNGSVWLRLFQCTETRNTASILINWRHTLSAEPVRAATASVFAEHNMPMLTVGYVLQPQMESSDPMTTGGKGVYLKKANKVVTVGGVCGNGLFNNKLHELNLSSRKWSSTGLGLERHGHSCVLFKNRIVVYGGHGPGGYNPSPSHYSPRPPGDKTKRRGPPLGYHKSTMCYELNSGEWCEMAATGAEDYRAGHTAVLCGHKMLVWGGWQLLVRAVTLPGRGDITNILEVRRDDMVCLDLLDNKWRKIVQNGAIPSGRCGHSALRHDGKMWVFGGVRDASEAGCISEPVPAPPQEKEDNSSDSDDLMCRSSKVQRLEQTSFRRQRVQRSNVANGVEYLSCFHVFDLDTKTWHPVSSRGDIPRAREGHSASVVSVTGQGVSMFIFGGESSVGPLCSCHRFVFDEGVAHSGFWRKVAYEGCVAPSPRTGHIMLCMTAERTKRAQSPTSSRTPAVDLKLAIFGGSNATLLGTGVQCAPPAVGSRHRPITLVLQYEGEQVAVPTKVARLGRQRRHNADTTSRSAVQRKKVVKSDVEILSITDRLTRGRTKLHKPSVATESQEGIRLTGNQQRGVTERLYYRPLFKSQKETSVKDEREEGVGMDPQTMQASIERLYYCAGERQGIMQLIAYQGEGQQKKLTTEQESRLTDRLYYKDVEKVEKKMLQLGKKYLFRTQRRHTARSRLEWQSTVSRLHHGQVTTKHHPTPPAARPNPLEEVTWVTNNLL